MPPDGAMACEPPELFYLTVRCAGCHEIYHFAGICAVGWSAGLLLICPGCAAHAYARPTEAVLRYMAPGS